MAKEYDKLKKEFSAIEKELGSAVASDRKIRGDLAMASGIRGEGCKQLGLEIQRCKDGGMTGKTVKEFESDKAVKAAMAEIERQHSQSVKHAKALAALHSGAVKKLETKFHDFKKRLREEIDKRDAKKNRKVLAVDSKSLPDLKKLLADAQKFQDTKLEILTAVPVDTEAELVRERDAGIKKALTETKDVKLSRFQTEMMTQAFDERIMKGKIGKAKKLHDEVIAKCKAAAAAIKARKQSDLMENKVFAAKAMKALSEIVAPYKEAKKDQWLKTKIAGSPKTKASIDGLEKLEAAARDALTKVANARLDA